VTRAEGGGEAERIVVLDTVGARPRARRGRRKAPQADESGEAELVPSVRATVIRTDPFESPEEAEAWLDGLRRDRAALEEEVSDGTRELNALLRAHRAAAANPYVRDVAPAGATVVRVGHGTGDQVADGRYASAAELPPPSPRSRIRRRADALAPDERLAALLGRREKALVCEELVLRAQSDLDAGRPREAALQARIALEAALAELGGPESGRLGDDLRALEERRDAVGRAANEALEAEPAPDLQEAVADVVERIDTALRRRRLHRG
jgi:hypothetical protein